MLMSLRIAIRDSRFAFVEMTNATDAQDAIFQIERRGAGRSCDERERSSSETHFVVAGGAATVDRGKAAISATGNNLVLALAATVHFRTN